MKIGINDVRKEEVGTNTFGNETRSDDEWQENVEKKLRKLGYVLIEVLGIDLCMGILYIKGVRVQKESETEERIRRVFQRYFQEF